LEHSLGNQAETAQSGDESQKQRLELLIEGNV